MLCCLFNVQDASLAVDDKAYFRELEAVYLLRLLLASCGFSLENCAYDLQDASALLTARMQRGYCSDVKCMLLLRRGCCYGAHAYC